jgi:hypothetical protein
MPARMHGPYLVLAVPCACGRRTNVLVRVRFQRSRSPESAKRERLVGALEVFGPCTRGMRGKVWAGMSSQRRTRSCVPAWRKTKFISCCLFDSSSVVSDSNLTCGCIATSAHPCDRHGTRGPGPARRTASRRAHSSRPCWRSRAACLNSLMRNRASTRHCLLPSLILRGTWLFTRDQPRTKLIVPNNFHEVA